MIYCDNAATTLMKPPEVAAALLVALANFGAANRASHGASMLASRTINEARLAIASLTGARSPLSVAFTSSATEALNLAIAGLVKPGDRVLTTFAEHNSVLRPLYLRGCDLDVIGCGAGFSVDIDDASRLVKAGGVKLLAVTHGSNVTGSITDVGALRGLCRDNGVIMLLDVSQTLGVIPVSADMADVICFTGHKGLFGPQGTGGVIAEDTAFEIVKTGGSGANSFDRVQSEAMPDVFEAGTLNSHAIYGMLKGTEFVSDTGVGAIYEKTSMLAERFIGGVLALGNITVYGETAAPRLPVVSLNVGGLTAADVAASLWDNYGVAVRAGFHCAPLMHRALGTATTGAVRFSFSYFNTEDEIDSCVDALREISGGI